MKTQTLEEYLAAGGKIKKVPPGSAIPKKREKESKIQQLTVGNPAALQKDRWALESQREDFEEQSIS